MTTTNSNFKVKNGLDVAGNITIAGTPSASNHAVTKAYADSAVSTLGTSASAALSTHSTDQTLHLTPSQNTWLDAVTATSAEVNRLSGVTSNIQTQLDAKIPLTQRGAANGVATLDATGLVPSSQLPSYVDDVLEYANLAGMPAVGETAKIYVALDTNKIYRWSGSVYIEISPTAGNSDTATKLATARTITATGDATWSVSFDGSANVSSALTLANSGVTSNTYGSSTAVPVITVDAKGRVTSASTATIQAGTGYTGSRGEQGVVTTQQIIDVASTIAGATFSDGVTSDAILIGEQYNFLGNNTQGIYTQLDAAQNILTVSALDATTTTKGVASFNPASFTVVGGVVSLDANTTGFTGSQGIQGVTGYTGSHGAVGYTGSGYGTTANVQMNSLGVGTAPSGTTGNVRATGDVTAYYSDDRLKNRLGDIVDAVEKLLTLDAFYYEANEVAQSMGYQPTRQVGVSAQQVQRVLPEAVAPAPISDEYLTVKYEKLIPLLIAAIKEQQLQIDALCTVIAEHK